MEIAGQSRDLATNTVDFYTDNIVYVRLTKLRARDMRQH